MMKILSYRNDGVLRVVSDTNVYEYTMITPYMYNKIEKYIKRNHVGRAWKLLKGLKYGKCTQNHEVRV